VDGPIAPGKTRREPGRIIRYDPFRPGHQRLRSTPLGKLKVVWQPSDAVFTDGSRLESRKRRTLDIIEARHALRIAARRPGRVRPHPPHARRRARNAHERTAPPR